MYTHIYYVFVDEATLSMACLCTWLSLSLSLYYALNKPTSGDLYSNLLPILIYPHKYQFIFIGSSVECLFSHYVHHRNIKFFMYLVKEMRYNGIAFSDLFLFCMLIRRYFSHFLLVLPTLRQPNNGWYSTIHHLCIFLYMWHLPNLFSVLAHFSTASTFFSYIFHSFPYSKSIYNQLFSRISTKM